MVRSVRSFRRVMTRSPTEAWDPSAKWISRPSVATAHVVVTASTTRENLYVAMTGGRDANSAYFGVVRHSGANLSAHRTLESEFAVYGGIARLAAELETIAADAQHGRCVTLLSRSGLTKE